MTRRMLLASSAGCALLMISLASWSAGLAASSDRTVSPAPTTMGGNDQFPGRVLERAREAARKVRDAITGGEDTEETDPEKGEETTEESRVATGTGTSAPDTAPDPAPRPVEPTVGTGGADVATARGDGPTPRRERLAPHIVALLTLADHPDLVTDAIVLQIATAQVQAENMNVGRVAGAVQSATALAGIEARLFDFTWETALDAEPDLARGELLGLFLSTDPDWTFVLDQGAADDRKTVAAIALLDKSRIEGRQPEFVAREVAPVIRRHLDLAVAQAPRDLWFVVELGAYPSANPLQWRYDFERNAIGVSQRRGRGPGGGVSLLTPFDGAPPVAGSPELYWIHDAFRAPRPTIPASTPVVSVGENAAAWRATVGAIGTSSGNTLPLLQGMALDRRITVATIPVEASTAEALTRANASLVLRVHIRARRVEVYDTSNMGGGLQQGATLVADLVGVQVLDPDGTIVAFLEPDAFADR